MGRSLYSAFLIVLASLFVILACARPERVSSMSASGGVAPAVDEAALEKLVSGDESFPDVPRIAIDELAARLGGPDMIVLDVRPQDQWLISDRKMRGAIHQNPETVETWAGAYPKDKTLVLYCA